MFMKHYHENMKNYKAREMHTITVRTNFLMSNEIQGFL